MDTAPNTEPIDHQLLQGQMYNNYCDEIQNSALDSRLYAELYFFSGSNSDYDDVIKEAREKHVTTDDSSSAGQTSNISVWNTSDIRTSNLENLSDATAMSNKNDSIDIAHNVSNAQFREISNEESASTNKTPNTSFIGNLSNDSTPNDRFQQLDQNHHDERRYSAKRKKYENDNHLNNTWNQQKSTQNSFTSPNTRSEVNPGNSPNNLIINAYNKEVANSMPNQVQLFSPAFYNLLFVKKPTNQSTPNPTRKLKHKKLKKRKNIYESRYSFPCQTKSIPAKVINNDTLSKNVSNEANTNSVALSEQDGNEKSNISAQNLPNEANTNSEALNEQDGNEKSHTSAQNLPNEANTNSEALNEQDGNEKSNTSAQNLLNEANTNSEVSNEQDRNEISSTSAHNVSNDTSEVIDISSDSEEESTSKYNAIETTEKKFEKILTRNDNKANNSESESEESIFEVPIPPKPAPLLIDLKDSDNESNNKSENKNVDSSNPSIISVPSAGPNSSNESPTIDVSDSDEQDSFVLNCTVVQKDTSSLRDIRTTNIGPELSTSKSPSNENSEITEENHEISNKILHNIDMRQECSKSKKNKRSTSTASTTASSSNAPPNKRINSPENYFFQPMSTKMKAFYDESWGGENFDMEKLRSKMPSDSQKWAIINEDKFGLFNRNKRYFGIVCNRCNKKGHKSPQCPEPFKNPICHMCGVKGHFESSCPHKKCLTCGTQQRMYTKICENCIRMRCSRCNSRGHSDISCPDLWRRYHDTVNRNNVESSQYSRRVMKPQHELFCCNCAKKGHNFDTCKKLQWSQHFSTPSHVVNYNGPAYISENLHDSPIANNRNDQVIHGSSNSSKSTSNNSINLLITRNKILTDSNRKPNINIDVHPSTVTGAKKKVICDVKTKSFKHSKLMCTSHLDLDCSSNIPADTLKDWEHLTTFFGKLATTIKVHFWIKQSDTKLRVSLTCNRSHMKYITDIILQYINRNNIERSRMFFEWHRDPEKMLDHHSKKISEMNLLNEDLLELYNAYTNLLSQTTANDNKDRAYELNKLADLQEKLLLILYKEGFADNSLQKLNTLNAKIKKRYKNQKSEKTKKKKSTKPNLVRFNILIKYIYFYNNVFTPYRLKNLSESIEKFKTRARLCDKIMANNSISSCMQKQNEESMPDKVYDSKTSKATLSLCKDSPKKLDENSLLVPSQSNDALLNFTNAQMYGTSEQFTSIAKSKSGEKKYKNFWVKLTRNLLVTAKKLSASTFLQVHVNKLENKLKNEMDVSQRDYKMLRKLVNKAMKKSNVET